MAHPETDGRVLDEAQITHFIDNGFVRLDAAFPRELADQARAILRRDLGCGPDDPASWTRPVVRLGMYDEAPFAAAADTPRLHGAFDQLVGAGRWLPCRSMGTFPVRFPAPDDPGDAGWRVDVSFSFDDPDFMNWRVKPRSKGRALLMLFLFSNVGDNDAPARIRIGSHRDIARQLAPAGETGLSLRKPAADGFAGSAGARRR